MNELLATLHHGGLFFVAGVLLLQITLIIARRVVSACCRVSSECFINDTNRPSAGEYLDCQALESDA